MTIPKFFRHVFGLDAGAQTSRDLSAFAIVEQPIRSPDASHPMVDQDISKTLEILQDEMRKLGRTQLKANTIAESEHQQIQQQLEQILVAAEGNSREALFGLLQVVDALETALQFTQELRTDRAVRDAWKAGIQMARDRLLSVLEHWEITPILALEQVFDPRYHEAVGVQNRHDVPEDTIVQEQRRGYLRGNQVFRYSEVIVAKIQGN